MLKLVQTFGAHAGRTREYDQDVVRIGRLPTCDFAFDPHADLDASGLHAEIKREGRDYVLTDCGSRNGTLIDGRPITRHVLADGDEIEFGTGGPRVRVTLPGRGVASIRPGIPTGPATPLDPPEGYAPAPLPSVRPLAAYGSEPPTNVGPPTTAPAAGAPDAVAIARIVDQRTRPLVLAVGLMGVLLILTMCSVTAIGVYLVTHG